MLKASKILFEAENCQGGTYSLCTTGEYHEFMPYSTTTRKNDFEETETITALICSRCLVLAAVDDELHQLSSRIAEGLPDQVG